MCKRQVDKVVLSDCYSPWKAVHHQDRLNVLKQGGQTVPLHVQFVPSNVCNNNCIFCPYRSEGYTNTQLFDKTQHMPIDKIYQCLDDFRSMGVKSILYTGGGEPSCHPNFNEILDKTVNVGLDFGLFTNGLILTDAACSSLSEAAFIRVSLNAATASGYSKIHGRSRDCFSRVKYNVRRITRSVNKDKTTVGVGFVVSKDNFLEVLDAARLAKELGVSNFRISGASTVEGENHFEGVTLEALRQAQTAKSELEDNSFKVFNLLGEKLEDMNQASTPIHKCHCKDLICYVGADCSVYLCCILAYNKRGLIGSFKESSFNKLWNSSGKVKMFDEFNPLKTCKGDICIYRNKNKFLDYCCRTQPKDVNFI